MVELLVGHRFAPGNSSVAWPAASVRRPCSSGRIEPALLTCTSGAAARLTPPAIVARIADTSFRAFSTRRAWIRPRPDPGKPHSLARLPANYGLLAGVKIGVLRSTELVAATK